MSNVLLLDKTRKIGSLLHNNDTSKVVFNDFCLVLSEILHSHVVVISKKGKVLGVGGFETGEAIPVFAASGVGGFLDEVLNERLLSVLSTKENVNLSTLGFGEEIAGKFHGIIAPIAIASERLGTLFIYKQDEQYEIDDLILCEYGTTVVGLEILRSVSEENAAELRKQNVMNSAIGTLSLSELEAIMQIFDELHGMEGMLIASKVADRAGLSRSVVVNAMRKLESAGIIETRSSGMKGTYIKVYNDLIYEEVEKIRRSRTRAPRD